MDVTEEWSYSITNKVDVDLSSEIRMKLFIMVYQKLFAVGGGDVEFMQHWMNSKNKALGDSPVNLCCSEAGLRKVLSYLKRK